MRAMTLNIPELRKLLAEATPRPWEVATYTDSDYSIEICHGLSIAPNGIKTAEWICEVGDGTGCISEVVEANVNLILATINALPDLLDEIERLRMALVSIRDGTYSTAHSERGAARVALAGQKKPDAKPNG